MADFGKYEPYQHPGFPGKWLVLSQKSKTGQPGFGDTFHSSEDDARKQAAFNLKLDEQDRKREALLEAERQQAAAEEAERQDIDGFMNDAPALARGKAVTVLNKPVTRHGKVTTVKGVLRELAGSGWKIDSDGKDFVSPEGYMIAVSKLGGATGVKYLQHLTGRKNPSARGRKKNPLLSDAYAAGREFASAKADGRVPRFSSFEDWWKEKGRFAQNVGQMFDRSDAKDMWVDGQNSLGLMRLKARRNPKPPKGQSLIYGGTRHVAPKEKKSKAPKKKPVKDVSEGEFWKTPQGIAHAKLIEGQVKTLLEGHDARSKKNPHQTWNQNGWHISYTDNSAGLVLSGWKNSFADTFKFFAKSFKFAPKDYTLYTEGGKYVGDKYARKEETQIGRADGKAAAKKLLFDAAERQLGFRPDPKKAGGEIEERNSMRNPKDRKMSDAELRKIVADGGHPRWEWAYSELKSRELTQRQKKAKTGGKKKADRYMEVLHGTLLDMRQGGRIVGHVDASGRMIFDKDYDPDDIRYAKKKNPSLSSIAASTRKAAKAAWSSTKQAAKAAKGALRSLTPRGRKAKKALKRLTDFDRMPAKSGLRKKVLGTTRLRRNPEATASAAYEMFHGKPSSRVVEYHQPVHKHSNLWELGTLVEIKLDTFPTGPKKLQRSVTIQAPDSGTDPLKKLRKQVRLTASEDCKQLYFTGGDQAIDLKQLGFKAADIHDSVLIGKVKEITYRTKKDFDKFKTLDYYHGLGEVTKVLPVLTYNPRDRRMYLSGGQYQIKREGIVN
jgi:hypothetical protein